MASCGGNWTEGMQMYGAILACPNPVTVFATKWARSMTSIIPLAADRFVIRPPAEYMIHRGQSGFYGLDQEADTFDIERRKATERMIRIYVARLKEQGMHRLWSPTRIRSLIESRFEKETDVWFSADEAKQWGFVDDVFDGDHDSLRARKRNRERRARMLAVLREPIKVSVTVT
jgi:ATP-dependent Clp protease protease subunit